MSRYRKLIIAFWVFIGLMLIWQFYDYDRTVKQAAIDHPQQEHFFFIHTNAASAITPAAHGGAYVRQTSFSAENNKPSPGSFTCSVTVKNDGSAKAVNVQVRVRPYRGVLLGDEDVAHSNSALKENDPMSQMGQWVSFPDLAPGESSTQKAVFLMQSNLQPGTNPGPEIQFETEKAAPAASL